MKVSVLIMTYNHEKFIRQALDSVLMQRTNFDFEIIISEDNSSDCTREIIQEYHNKLPNIISLQLSEKNLHSNRIVVRGIDTAKGEYIALLDGDDYWTSPEKLQRQSDFLDSHPECAICFHNASVIKDDETSPLRNWTPSDTPEITGLDDLWLGNYIATSSTMFRNGLIGTIPEWYDKFFPITDWPLHLLNAEHGKIGYLNCVMSVYRHHKGGMYSAYSEKRKQEETFKFYNLIDKSFQYKYHKKIQAALSKYFYEWSEEYLNRRNYSDARNAFKLYLSGRPVNKHISIYHLLKLYLKIYSSSKKRRTRTQKQLPYET